jgi:hypothetical protein
MPILVSTMTEYRPETKKPVSPFKAVKHWRFVVHSNGLEPLTFGSVVRTGILLRF